MNCEEFEVIGLDAERDVSLSETDRAAAREHARTCSRCAGLQDSWQAAAVDLRAFAEDTAMAQAPARVEMRLRQEFRTQHVTLKMRRAAVLAAWALATAAVLAGALSWRNWQITQHKETARQLHAPQSPANLPESNTIARANDVTPAQQTENAQERHPAENTGSATVVAENNTNGFTLLPGVLPAETDDTEIFRVRMQRGALGALGLPVNEERAGEWIQVDLLVGNDGLPQAVRLPK